MKIIKRNGEEREFQTDKIRAAIIKANKTVPSLAMLSDAQIDRIVRYVDEACEKLGRPVAVEEIQDMVEQHIMAEGAYDVAKNYIIYRKKRERARNTIQIRTGKKSKKDITDQSLLLVSSMTEEEVTAWDRNKITDRIVSALDMSRDTAAGIAKDVESQIIASGMTRVSTSLIRELVNNALIDHGYNGQLQDLTMYRVPRDFIWNLMGDKNNENSNIASNNPEAVSFDIASLVLKQFAFDAVFSKDVSEAHATGLVHVHDANFPHRYYCGSHSIEYIKKYGLKGLVTLGTTSKPAKSASVLTGHLNTYLASMQAYYAGALGLGYVNTFYAPYLMGMTDKEIKQIAQEIIFNCSQNAFSRGGQCLFIDTNVNTGVPSYFKNVPAIGPGGKYMFVPAGKTKEEWVPLEEATPDDEWWLVYQADGNIYAVVREKDGKQVFQYPELGKVLTYGDFEDEAQRMCSALLDVWYEGDANGHVFEFPKCDFHVDADTFTDPRRKAMFDKACRLASHNGSTYFVFDRDSVSLASCCRLKVTITDKSMLLHPEKLRTVGFGNVTVNIPQCAYRAQRATKEGDAWDAFIKEIDNAMDIAVKCHMEKRKFLEYVMKPGGPMWQIAKPANDGNPYMALDGCVYIIGMIGVNDAIQFLYGKQLHESDEAFDMGLKIVSHMFHRCKEYSEQYGLTFKLEESPAESAARRLAKADLMYYRPEALQVYKGGDEKYAYYTNSIHIAADADVSLVDRIRKQSMFHSAIESGAIIHAFIGEEKPEPGAIAELVTQVFTNTQAAQLTFSPEFTYCQDCGAQQRGLHEKCDQCGSDNVVGETRVVGYFSRINNMVPLQRELY